MNNKKEKVKDFFEQYAARFNKALNSENPDVHEIVSSFADYFIESSPAGVIEGKNDDGFLKRILEGYRFYRNIGITSMNISSTGPALLDAFHAMANVRWVCNFIKKDHTKGSIEFSVIYLLREEHAEYKIFAYITGDEQAALKEYGLI